MHDIANPQSLIPNHSLQEGICAVEPHSRITVETMRLVRLLLIVAASSARCSPVPCSPSPMQTLPVIGQARGVGPWLVNGSEGRRASRAEHPTKTLWIFKTTSDRVVIRGQHLHTGATTKFQVGGPDSPLTDVMVVEDPWKSSVIPGGATWEIKNQYLFIPSQVYYPSPGCFTFDVTVGTAHGTIVLEIE